MLPPSHWCEVHWHLAGALRGSFVVHWTFLELRSKTALKHPVVLAVAAKLKTLTRPSSSGGTQFLLKSPNIRSCKICCEAAGTFLQYRNAEHMSKVILNTVNNKHWPIYCYAIYCNSQTWCRPKNKCLSTCDRDNYWRKYFALYEEGTCQSSLMFYPISTRKTGY